MALRVVLSQVYCTPSRRSITWRLRACWGRLWHERRRRRAAR